MTERLIFASGMCIYIMTFTACNYSLWFHEVEVVTQDAVEIEKEIDQKYDVYRQEPYIQSEDQLDKVLHSDANRWTIDPSGRPKS